MREAKEKTNNNRYWLMQVDLYNGRKMVVVVVVVFFCFDVLFCMSMCAVGETDSESKVGFASVPRI